MILALAILLGFLLDELLGDPPPWPHPVRWIGKIIQRGETWTRRLLPERWGGVLLLLVVLGAAGLAVWGLLECCARLHPYAHFGVSALLVYWGLAARSLADHTGAFLLPLEKGDLPTARLELAKVVGRDTCELGERDLCRACVETVAENTTDGVVAPLFYAALGGPIALWVYKAINTLDSMIGYRNERYARFGWAAARLDDLANFLPARLTLLLMPLAAVLGGEAGWNALRIGRRDGGKHPSPNAGLAEAAMAGALNVQLGGPSTYAGVPSDKPVLGDDLESLDALKVRRSVAVMRTSAWLALLVACGLAIGVEAGRGLFQPSRRALAEEDIRALGLEHGPFLGVAGFRAAVDHAPCEAWAGCSALEYLIMPASVPQRQTGAVWLPPDYYSNGPIL